MVTVAVTFVEAHSTALLLFLAWAFSAAMSTMPPLSENAGYLARWAHDWLQLLAANMDRRKPVP